MPYYSGIDGRTSDGKRTAERLLSLKSALNSAGIPSRRVDGRLLLATWNIREFGQSKYGLERVFKVVLDLLVVVFLRNFFAKPIYLFGGCGIAAIILSFLTIGTALVMRIFFHVSLILTPLPLLSALLFLVGMMSILMGLVAEMMVRTYYESQGARAYLVRELINFSRGPGPDTASR